MTPDNYRTEIAILRGRNLAMGTMLTVFGHILYRDQPQKLRRLLTRFRDDFTTVPFVISDDEAEGFRQAMDEILEGLQHLPPTS